MKLRWLASTCLAGFTFAVFPAFAQDAPSSSAPAPASAPAAESHLEEVVVTAQRRTENLQHAGIAVTAITGDTLSAAGVTRPTELTSLVPALQVSQAAGPYNLFYLRGVGNFNGNAFSDSAIAFNFDGVYIGRPSSTTGFFYDLERVEVVKGPQGTLYGRNATGGAINVITKKPDLGQFGGDVSAEYGNYDAVRVDGAINIPVGDTAAFRLAGIHVSHDGYMNDGTDDQDDWGGRLSFRADPTESLKINLVADYFHQGGTGVGSTITGMNGVATPNAFRPDDRVGFLSPGGQAAYASQPNTLLGRTFYPVGPGLRPYQDNQAWGISGSIDWDTPVGTLTIIPAHRESNLNYLNFLPGFYIRQKEDSAQNSIEARFATKDDKPIRLLVGGFYYDEKTNDPIVAYEHQANVSIQSAKLATQSEAVFGRVTWAITPQIRLTAGGRYTSEQKDLDGLLQAASRICLAPTSYFPTYSPGCPTAAQLPYSLTPPAPDFDPTQDGTITVPATINELGPNARHASFSRFTYHLGADWDITPSNLLYGSYETGFKSGGFFFSSDSGVYRPEKIAAWTVGSKNRFLDNRLQLNVEAFYWRYHDQQISHLGLDSAGIAIFPTENVGAATFRGFEVETKALVTENTTLSADIQFLDAKYNDFVYITPNLNGGVSNGTGCANSAAPALSYTVDCSGFRPPNAPKWTVNLSAQQRMPLASGASFVADARAHFQTRTLTGLEFTPVEYQGSYWMFDGAVTYYAPGRKYFVGAFINNAFNEGVISGSYPTPFSLFDTASLRPPRTFGGRVGVKF